MSTLSREFLFAGRAVFLVQNPQGERVTVKLNRSLPKVDRLGNPMPPVFWVMVRHMNDAWTLIGKLPNVDSDAGVYPDSAEIQTLPTRPVQDQRLFDIAQWAINLIVKQAAPPANYTLDHAGHCGKCGRVLTDEDSRKVGLGPTCRRK